MTPMTPDTPVIETNNLVRRYGRADAVDGLNLRVEPGRCYGFFGRNGAGKTTTISSRDGRLRGGVVHDPDRGPARDGLVRSPRN